MKKLVVFVVLSTVSFLSIGQLSQFRCVQCSGYKNVNLNVSILSSSGVVLYSEIQEVQPTIDGVITPNVLSGKSIAWDIAKTWKLEVDTNLDSKYDIVVSSPISDAIKSISSDNSAKSNVSDSLSGFDKNTICKIQSNLDSIRNIQSKMIELDSTNTVKYDIVSSTLNATKSSLDSLSNTNKLLLRDNSVMKDSIRVLSNKINRLDSVIAEIKVKIAELILLFRKCDYVIGERLRMDGLSCRVCYIFPKTSIDYGSVILTYDVTVDSVLYGLPSIISASVDGYGNTANIVNNTYYKNNHEYVTSKPLLGKYIETLGWWIPSYNQLVGILNPTNIINGYSIDAKKQIVFSSTMSDQYNVLAYDVKTASYKKINTAKGKCHFMLMKIVKISDLPKK